MAPMASNMTPSEYFHMHGTLPVAVMEKLVALDETTTNIENAITNIEEGRGAFCESDFLQPIIKRLLDLKKNVRGNNRDDVDTLIIAVEQLETEMQSSTDYGRCQLDAATDKLYSVEV